MATSELDEAALAALTERYSPHAGSMHYDGCELTHSACAVTKLVDEVRRLRERERAWRMQANEMDLAATRANAKLRAARQRIAEVEGALEKFGNHSHECDAFWMPTEACSCGYSAYCQAETTGGGK